MIKKVCVIFSLLLILILGVFAGCSQNPSGSQPNKNSQIPLSEQQKNELLTKLQQAASKDDAATFAKTLSHIYKNNWNSDPDLRKQENDFYMKWFAKLTKEPDNVLKIAEAVYSEVPESFKFKYLKIHALEKMGLEAFKKGEYEKAKDYASQMLAIEHRPEAINLLAKSLYEEANTAFRKKEYVKVKSLLKLALEMQTEDPDIKKKLEELQKKVP